MLRTLHIENYALIRCTDITFAEGFVGITGETGAGKSIILGAIALLLGQRADVAVLANKEEKCIVEAQLDIAGLSLQPLFAEYDVDYDDMLILRREILPSAKSRAFANDTPVSLPFLRALAPRIIDVHSQHQTLTLSDSTFRLSLLDTLCTPSVLSNYQATYGKYADLKAQLEKLVNLDAANRREVDYMQFRFDELVNARLQPGEQDAVEQESQLLAHAESVAEALTKSAQLLDNDTEYALLSQLRAVKNVVSTIASYHPEVPSILSRIDSAYIELNDINSTIQSLSSNVVYDPDRQREVDDRLDLIYSLQKKHNVDSVEALIAIRDDLDSRLNDISSFDERIRVLMEHVDAAFSEMQHHSEVLTEARRKAASLIEENIHPTLSRLGMAEARFSVALSAATNYGPFGHDAVAFLFNANRGGEMRDISKVASGGEMSRLMLALKNLVTSRTLLPTIIFDEIDTGVSGDISVAVGEIMCSMAERMQVVAITHLPQIAARASQHLKVYKQVDDSTDRTVSMISELSAEQRLHELAVMLSSEPPTEAAIQTARELMTGKSNC